MNALQFENPLGFWALLAVPALVAVHFLREKTRRVQTSTLFLIEPLLPFSPTGTVWHRFKNSAVFWLQIAAALLAIWVLVRPRWTQPGTWRRVTLVLDDSASMHAFREDILRDLPKALTPLSRSPVHTEWSVVCVSNPAAPLYRGSDIHSVWRALARWEPRLPEGDFRQVLTSAVLANGQTPGAVIWVTDRLNPDLPSGVQTLAFGHSLENCGWIGGRVWTERDKTYWEALVSNWGTSVQQREWWWQNANGRSTPEKLILQPGEVLTIRGTFPDNVTRGELQLSGDAFDLDDTFPMLRPQPRALRWGAQCSDAVSHFLKRVADTVPGMEFGGLGNFNLWVGAELPSGSPTEDPKLRGISALLRLPANEVPTSPGVILPENHPLVAGGGWDMLQVGGSGGLAPGVNDGVLVWRGSDPLIWLTQRDGTLCLTLNFSLDHSNADKVPAMVLLLSRFFLLAQQNANGMAAENVVAGEKLSLVAKPGWHLHSESGGEVALSAGLTVAAPYLGGFFRVRDSANAVILEGAAHFEDVRESDFHDAVTTGSVEDLGDRLDEVMTRPDAFSELWSMLAGMALLGSWALLARNGKRRETGAL